MQLHTLALLSVIAGLLLVNACRIEPSSLKGDLTALDLAITFNGNGQVSFPKTSFGGSGFTFVLDVFVSDTTGSGCLYSAGTPGKSDYLEVKLDERQVVLTVADEVASSFRVLELDQWNNIVITIDYSNLESPAVRLYLNGIDFPMDSAITKPLAISQRQAFLGFCVSDASHFNGVMDNLIIFNEPKTQTDAEWYSVQFFPLVHNDNLVVYFPFNDLSVGSSGFTKGHTGASANAFSQGQLLDGPVAEVKAKTSPKDVVDVTCAFSGAMKQGDASAEENLPPYYASARGGATTTVRCMEEDETNFIINQFWMPEGGIKQITVKTSDFHYWRISSPGLTVEHRTWGGWHILPRGSDLIEYDQTTYKFTDDAVMIQSRNYGWIKITERNGRLNYEYGINTANCPLHGQPVRTSWCDHLAIEEFDFDFSTEPVPEMPFGSKSTEPGVAGTPSVLACPPPSEQYRPDLFNPPPPPPPPPPPMLPPPPPAQNAVDPCTKYSSGTSQQQQELAKFKQTCGTLYTSGTAVYNKCVSDSCVTGTPPSDAPDCSTQILMAAVVPGFELDPKCAEEPCPNGCTGNGQCQQDGSCLCDDGKTGKDCSEDQFYPCFTATAPGGDVHINPVLLTDSNGVRVTTQSLTDGSVSLPKIMGKRQVADSLVVYLISTADSSSATRQQNFHLALMANNGLTRSTQSSGVTVAVTGASTSTVADWKENAASVSKSLTSGVHEFTFSWEFNGRAGVLLQNLPSDWNGQITISGQTGSFSQLLIGSAFGKDLSTGILSVYKYTSNSFTIAGGNCENTCVQHDTCEACSSDPKCGWCLESATCMPGNPSGPTYAGSCANWRYTFDSAVSRRLTHEYAHPVSPGYTDVFLSSATDSDTLPLEINVNVEEANLIQWDVIFLAEWDGNHKATWQNKYSSVLSVLRTYPNLGVGIAKHSSHSSGYRVVKALSNPRDEYWFGQHIASAAAENIASYDLFDAMRKLTTTSSNPVEWRAGARKILIITADSQFTIPAGQSAATLRSDLLKRDVVPVFVVTPNVAAQYQTLVDNLGFGFVETLSARSDNLPQITARAIDLVAGHAATYYSAAGHIDTAEWDAHADSYRMYGLDSNFVARFTIPLHRDAAKPGIEKTVLNMPAFGKATLENVVSDRPVAMAVPLHSSGKEDEDQFIQLQGRSFRNLLPTIPRITAFPTKGTLYQVDTATIDGKPTDVAADEVIEFVDDKLGRVAYRPPAGQSGANFDSFTFVMSDGCTDSDPVTVIIDVIAVNDQPVTDILPPSGREDEPLVIFFRGTDEEDNDLESWISESIHGMAEDGSMIMDGNHGTLYQYNGAILQNEANAPTGSVIDTSSGPVKITDSQGRAIYWPATHTNSHSNLGKVPELLVKPCVNYYVKETNTQELFESEIAQVPIDVRSVNDFPLIFGDRSADSTSYTYDWPTPEVDIGCWQHETPCVFEEDFGSEYPWNARYEYLYLGGGDIEKSQLTIRITTVDCPEDVILQNDLIGERNIRVGDSIIDNDPDELHPLIRFRPGPDGNNENAGRSNPNLYCTIGYRLSDENGDESLKEHRIQISVTPVDDPPRLRSQDSFETVLEETPKSFEIDGVDPEGSEFSIVATQCDDLGTFEVCSSEDCTETVTVDCANLGNGQDLPRFATTDSGFGIRMIYTSGPITSLSQGLNYASMNMRFRDASGSLIGETFNLGINVVSLNQAPNISVEGIYDEALFEISGQRYSGAIDLEDPDVGNGDMTLTMEITALEDGDTEGRMEFDETALSDGDVIENDPATRIVLRGKLPQLQAALAKFAVTGKPFGKYDVALNINDNGYFGQCEDPNGVLEYTGEFCPLDADLIVHVVFADQSIINAAIISGAGVGILGAGVVAAVVLTNVFNKGSDSEGYTPWNSFEQEGSVNSNPLYASGEIGGESAIYNDASNADLGGDSYL